MIDYVLVRTARKRVLDVHEALARIPAVREVHALWGDWDFIVKVHADAPADPGALLWAVSSIEGVVESKWLGASRIASESRIVSNLSNSPMRSDAL